MVVVSPYPQAAQRLWRTWYARLPQRLHFMWTVLPWRLPIDGVPFPTAVT